VTSRKVGLGFLAVLTLFSGKSWADFSLAPRYEYITGNGEEMANRILLKSKLNFSRGSFALYVDGFGEFDNANKTEYEIRRSPHRGYLQEAYVEFKSNAIYVRAGRQAMRWSEMWVVPSLDIWTARRWNRMYLDPLSEQLVHPTGVSFTYAKQNFSIDLVGITNLAENSYPLPMPPPAAPEENEVNAGARIQADFKSFHFSGIAAKQEKKYIYGMGANYAFDSAVPKIELGRQEDTSAVPVARAEMTFAAAGVDVFLGNWIFTPQVTVSELMSIYYVSAQWKVEPHDFQVMGFTNPDNKDYFWSLNYSYNLNRYFSVGGFLQEYYGENGTLHWIYRQITGDGVVAGLRLEMNSDWAF